MSATPMNLEGDHESVFMWRIQSLSRSDAYFLRMLKNVFSLLESSWLLSPMVDPGVGVPARELLSELASEGALDRLGVVVDEEEGFGVAIPGEARALKFVCSVEVRNGDLTRRSSFKIGLAVSGGVQCFASRSEDELEVQICPKAE